MNKKRPNILYVMPDEFRQRAMGFRGEDPTITPAIDRFARESLELENVFSNYPVCSPHRAMLFTGQYPCSNSVMGNCNSDTRQFGVRLSANTTCLSDVLKSAGYSCGYVGKWHLESPEESDAEYLEPRRADGMIWDAFTPQHRRHGFDYWFSYGCCDQHLKPHYWDNTNDVAEVKEYPGQWSTAVEAEQVKQFLCNEYGEREADAPFFMMWAPNPPHMPFEQVPEKYKALYADKDAESLLNAETYTAMKEPAPEILDSWADNFEQNMQQARDEVADYFASVSGVDDMFGEVLDVLEREGLAEDTLVIFASDHGELMGSHGLLRKGPWFDECVKIPYLMRLPGVLEPGKKEFYMNTPDIMPTLLDLLGLGDEIPSSVEGQSLCSLLIEDAEGVPEKTELGGLGYFINPGFDARGIRTKDHYLVVLRDAYDGERYILYDLVKDPKMFKDVAEEQPEVVRELREDLERWMEVSGDWWLRSRKFG